MLNGQIVQKVGGTVFAQNAIPHLFSNVKLTIGTQLVENINQVGHVSSLMYNVLYPKSKAEHDGLEFMWTHDTADTAVPATNDGFKIRQKYLIATPTTNGKFK